MNSSLPHISNIIIKWILCFCNEKESIDTDIILCDNLEDYNIVNIANPLSEHILKDEAIVNLKICDYDIENDSLQIFQQNVQPHSNYNISSDNMEVVDEHELARTRNTVVRNEVYTVEYRCRYRTIQIPLTKFLFMKVVNLKMSSNEKFSDDELYRVIDCLLNLLNDELPFLRVFAQQLLDDTKLCDRLCAIDKDRKEEGTPPKNVSYHMKQKSAIYTIQNSFSMYTTDEFGAAAVFSSDSMVKPHLRANLHRVDYFFKPSYLRMDGRFVINNHEILAKIYEIVAPTFSLNVDVDFSDVFYEMARNFADESHSNKRMVEKLSETFGRKFFRLTCLEICIFRFMGIHANLDFSAMSAKQLHIYYRECSLNKGALLPKNVRVLSLVESTLCCNLALPDTLEAVTLERTEIMKYCVLKINDACDKINMILVTGAVHIPYNEKTLDIEFPKVWSFKLSRSRNVIEELVINDVEFMSSTAVILSNIRKITLRNITMNDSSVSIVFLSDIEEITLDKFYGCAQFKGFTNELPILAHFNGGKFHSTTTKNAGMLDIYMEDAILLGLTSFLPTVSSIDMSRVDIRPIGVLHLSACIKEFSISNWIGAVNFDFIPKFKGFEFRRAEMFDKMNHKLHFKKARNGQPSHLYVADLQIQEPIHFGPEIDEYEFHNVIVVKSNYVAVDKNFKRVKLTNCKGKFKISGIVSNDQFGTVDVYNYSGHLEVSRANEESFDILVRNLTFYKLLIKTNINTAEFDQVRVVNWLRITSLQCKRLILNKFIGQLSVPNIASFKALKLFNLEGLNTLSELPALIKQVRSTRKTPVNVESNQVVTLSCTDIDMPIVISGDNDVNICISKCTFPVNVTDVLIDAVADKSLFCVVAGTEFYLNSSCQQQLSELILVCHHFHGIWQIKKDVRFLSLTKITSNVNSVLQLNEGLKTIRVDSSKIDIDTTNAKNLRTITLINTISIVYNPAVHHSLSYLSISDMNIDCGFDLVPSFSTFLLQNCILVPDVVIKVNEGISLLSISRFEGTIDMTGVTGLKNMKFNQRCTLYYDKCTRTTQNSLLYIENYTFEHDVMFSNDIETIHLKQVQTAEKTKLTLGKGCKRLKLESLAVNIDSLQAALLEKLTLRDLSDFGLKSFLTGLSTVKILMLENVGIRNDLKLPDQIRTVVLRRIKLANGSQFIFNRECNEVRLHHCSGVYDLSQIENLEVLGLLPELMIGSEFKVSLPSLDNVQELDIAYNLNNECLTYHCPTKYVNLQSLTVRSLDHFNKPIPYPHLSFTRNDIFGSIDNNPCLSYKIFTYMRVYQQLSDSKANSLNIKMNMFMNEFFTFNLRNKLKYLNLVGCNLNEENVRMLKEFTNLHTLVIDCAFLDNSLFLNIPDQLETLEINDRKVHENLRVNLHDLNFTTVQSLKRHKSIKNIMLGESIMRYRHIFDCLPLRLESLKIKKFPDAVNFCAQSEQKIVVRRLTVMLDGPDTYPLTMIDTNPMISEYYQLFNLLREYINFNELEELALEASGKLVSLDEKTYQIK